jgi:hypothetical protein
VDKQGKNVLVANYGGGSVACLPINPDGTLAPASAFIQHHGGSVDKGRQTSPHAHSINLDPAGRFAFVPDLGLDKIMIYRFDSEKGTLTPNTPDHASVAPGSGPRHFTFHPSGKYAYVITEMGNTITAFDYDAEHGSLKEIQTISTLPDDFNGKGKSFTAEVLAHPATSPSTPPAPTSSPRTRTPTPSSSSASTRPPVPSPRSATPTPSPNPSASASSPNRNDADRRLDQHATPVPSPRLPALCASSSRCLYSEVDHDAEQTPTPT